MSQEFIAWMKLTKLLKIETIKTYIRIINLNSCLSIKLIKIINPPQQYKVLD